MSPEITEFDFAVLEWVSYDCETLHTIDANISADLSKVVEHAEIHEVLLSLQDRGLVDPYRYDAGLAKYIRAAICHHTAIGDYWWFATEEGQRLLERRE